MCDACFVEWEAAAEKHLKARYSSPITLDEIDRLRAIELAAAKVYRNRGDIFNDPVRAHGFVLGIGRALNPKEAPALPRAGGRDEGQ